MMESQKSYYAIIPAKVRYDVELINGAKLLYGEITALSNEKGFCWASDSYFSKLYNVSKKTVQTWLKSLEQSDYISREVKYKKGTNEIEYRYIRIGGYPTHEKVHTPMHEKVRENNTKIFNNTINNTSTKEHSSNTDSMEDCFNKIWKLYPKKTMRKEALAVYKHVIKKGVTDDVIVLGINNYLQDLKVNTWKKPMDGGRWFQKERWNDEYDVPQSQKNKSYGGVEF